MQYIVLIAIVRLLVVCVSTTCVISLENLCRMTQRFCLGRQVYLRRFGGLSLIGLELLASLHFHGAVNDTVWCERLQTLDLHNNHLRINERLE